MNQERRHTPRLRTYLPVRVSPPIANHASETLTRDVSLGGVRFISPIAIPVLSECRLELTLAEGREPLVARGRIVWFQQLPHSDQFEIGASFIELSPQNQRRLSTYLEKSSVEPARSSS